MKVNVRYIGQYDIPLYGQDTVPVLLSRPSVRTGHRACPTILSLLLVLSVILPAVTFGCSSMPRYEPSPFVSEADNLYRLGKRFASQGLYEASLRSFRLALQRYTLVDNIDGVVLTRLAIIGANVQNEDKYFYDEELAALSEFILTVAPQYYYNLLLLQTELAFIDEEFLKVIELTYAFDDADIMIASQLLSYRLLSLSKEGQSSANEYNRLKRTGKTLGRLYRRNRLADASIYSYVNYVLGYHNVSRENWEDALIHLQTALEVDKQNDHTANIAKSLYYLAVVYENLELTSKAIAYYRRAAHIFELVEDQQNYDLTMGRLADIEK